MSEHSYSPLLCAFIKTESDLASTEPSVISSRIKTQGNSPHFRLGLAFPDLSMLLSLEIDCRHAVANIALWSGSPYLFGTSRIIYSNTLQKFRVSCCPGGVDKAPVVDMENSKTQVDIIVTGAGCDCVPMSNRACYLCRLGHSYNKRQRIRSSGNTNLSLTSDPKDLLHVLTACRLFYLLNWDYLAR